METHIKQIISYIEYLKSTFHWQITIHHFQYATGQYASLFSPYQVHNNPYCIYLKNTNEIWDTCISRQTQLLQKLDTPISFGMCHCGVEEYILPIHNKENNIGFVSVSGYRKNTEAALRKLTHVSDKYQLDPENTKKFYFEHLNPDVPDMDTVYTLVYPLISMLEYFYIKQKELYQDLDTMIPDEASALTRALLYLEHHYREHVTLQNLCTFCNCSSSYMSHMFKQQIGKSIREYVNELRINEAKMLLKSTNLPITDIALNVGFSSSNYFANVFREYCNCSPTDYRSTSVAI